MVSRPVSFRDFGISGGNPASKSVYSDSFTECVRVRNTSEVRFSAFAREIFGAGRAKSWLASGGCSVNVDNDARRTGCRDSTSAGRQQCFVVKLCPTADCYGLGRPPTRGSTRRFISTNAGKTIIEFGVLTCTSVSGWRRGVVVSGVRRMSEVTLPRARLVLGRVTVFGRVCHLGISPAD